jgi:hypothetical protein
VLGHASWSTDQGSYCYGYFNETVQGQNARMLVEHEDINALSIFANSLVEKAKQVSHGIIRELSLVLAGANPGALIDNIEIAHSDGSTDIIADEAIIYTGLELEHADGAAVEEESEDNVEDEPITGDTTVQDGLRLHDSGAAGGRPLHGGRRAGAQRDRRRRDRRRDRCLRQGGHHPRGQGRERDERTQRLRDREPGRQHHRRRTRHVLSHDAMRGIAADAVKRGSLKEAFEDYAFKHGIENIDTLFPDARTITDTPEFDSAGSSGSRACSARSRRARSRGSSR